MQYRHGWRRLAYSLFGVVLALTFAACNPFKQVDTHSTQSDSSLPPLKPFPEVALLETPALPDWIEQISPTEQADALAQVRIRF
ncbi:MAG: hypothetical protein AAGL17_01705, partial [Cyanobacteria bacterium J06576_12]